MAVQLIVGLGNPGSQYAHTRHNAGVWMVDMLAEQYHFKLQREKKFHGEYCHHIINGQRIHILFPHTFMNNSGDAVQAVASYYKLSPESILVIHDELDLLPGNVKLKHSGGHAGHNGLRSLISQLNSTDFWRIRIGIGHPGQRDMVASYVLSPSSQSEYQKIQQAMVNVSQVFSSLLTGDFAGATRKLHAKET